MAVGGLGEDPTVRRKFWIFLFVRPEFQGVGIGTALFDLLLQDARRQLGECLRASVQAEEGTGLAFSAHRGFKEKSRDWQSILDVRTAATSQLPSLVRSVKGHGIEITTLAREGANDPEVGKRLCQLDLATSPDAPRMDPYVPWTYEQFKRAELEGTQFLPESWFIAKVGDDYVGHRWAQREAADPKLLQRDFTGTRKEHRRRGLARTLKLCLTDYAQRNGFERIRTNNSSLNAPMWQLNVQLGFRRVSTTLQLETPLV